ncbi:hypothetical protein, partial [Serratia ficaria]|uniref:hypothetical protein n=1 Tax=Serratia ficaria TaxID=61651 RepID=UPI0021C8E216
MFFNVNAKYSLQSPGGEENPPCQDSCRLELKNFRGPETTKMNTYSPERKAALIARMMPPHNQSVVQLA